MLRVARKAMQVMWVLLTPSCVHRGAGTEVQEPTPSLTPGDGNIPDALLRVRERGLMVPVEGVSPEEVRDTFSAPRGDRVHAALDIAARRGTRVLSADSGRVWKIRSNTLGGRTVYVLDLAGEFVHYYAHLDRYLPGLAEGQVVGPGDILGYVGTTGNAAPTEPHLHYQLLRYGGNGRWWDGEPTNPYRALRHPGKATNR